MRRIQLPDMTSDNNDPIAIITAALQPPPDQGVPLTQLAARLAIIDKLRTAAESGTLLLEDAEWQELAGAIEQAQWLRVDPDILACCQAVLDAPEVPVQETTNEPQHLLA